MAGKWGKDVKSLQNPIEAHFLTARLPTKEEDWPFVATCPVS